MVCAASIDRNGAFVDGFAMVAFNAACPCGRIAWNSAFKNRSRNRALLREFPYPDRDGDEHCDNGSPGGYCTA